MAEFDKNAIANMRRSYGEEGLNESDLEVDPIQIFRRWLKEAAENPIVVEANAMILSTVVDSTPTSRSVLLKDVTDAGFTFFTNYSSAKSMAISKNENVALLFPWYPMERQVKILGTAERISGRIR